MMKDTAMPAPVIGVHEILEHCTRWAQDAAVTARKHFRNPTEISFKADESPVTAIDRLIENELKTAILSIYPNHVIFGEETGVDGSMLGNLWVIDPIDGTRSFISGNPLFGMLLAHLRGGTPVAGVISMPMLGEIYAGGLGCGATCNGVPIHVSDKRRIEDCTLYINEGEKLMADHPKLLSRLLQTGQTRRFGYDCYPHALLAAGHIDAVVDYDLQPYDYLAVSVVIESAGGIMTDWHGQKLGLSSDGAVVSAATPELHAALLKLLHQ